MFICAQCNIHDASHIAGSRAYLVLSVKETTNTVTAACAYPEKELELKATSKWSSLTIEAYSVLGQSKSRCASVLDT